MESGKIRDEGKFVVSWQTEGLRATAFLTAAGAQGADSWWPVLLGSEPDTRVSRPGGFLLDSGQLDGNQFLLNVQVGRVDWTVSPIAPAESQNIPTVGLFPGSSDTFKRIVLRWLEFAPPIARLAFGATLALPVKNLADGKAKLVEYLPVAKAADLEEASNFTFSINRPRQSTTGIAGLRINRLSQWAILNYRSLEMQISPGSKATLPAKISSVDIAIAVRLGLDISTHEDFQGTLPKERLGDIFLELMDAGKEISDRGDVK